MRSTHATVQAGALRGSMRGGAGLTYHRGAAGGAATQQGSRVCIVASWTTLCGVSRERGKGSFKRKQHAALRSTAGIRLERFCHTSP